jgi:hypothetical protein
MFTVIASDAVWLLEMVIGGSVTVKYINSRPWRLIEVYILSYNQKVDTVFITLLFKYAIALCTRIHRGCTFGRCYTAVFAITADTMWTTRSFHVSSAGILPSIPAAAHSAPKI